MVPDPAITLPAPNPDPVAQAYAALISALGGHAMAHEADYERASNFRSAAIGQRDRWAQGTASAVRTATPRAKKVGGT